MNPIQPGLPVETFEIPTAPSAATPVVGAAPPPAPPNWVEQRQAEMAQAESLRVDAELAAQTAADAETGELEALRQKHGAIPAAAGSFARGVLDALLAPAAGTAATLEATGEGLGVKTLKDFGRSFGKAATGKSAMEALAFVMGGGGTEGAEYADISNRLLAEQHEARPTLTTVSRLAGAAGVGLGLGGAASGHTAASAMIGLNTLEGAAMGAQTAYDESAPLRDVLTSAAIGGLIGGATTGAVEGIMHGAKHLPDMSKVFGSVQRKAEQVAVESVTGKVASELGDDAVVARVARRTRELIGKEPGEIAPILDAKAAESIASELSLVRSFDGDVPGAMGKIDDLAASYKRSGVQELAGVGDEIEKAAAGMRAKLTSEVPEWDAELLGGIPPMRAVLRDPTLSELAALRRELGPIPKAIKGAVDPVADAKRSLSGLVAKELEHAASSRGPAFSRLWKETTQAADDFQLVAQHVARDVVTPASPSFAKGAVQSGITTALIAAVTASNPIAAVGWGIAGAAGRGVMNKVGGAAASKLMNAFARMGTRVSIRQAGGREMAEVMTELAKAKRFGAELAEAAGDNPAARQQAESLASDVAAQAIEKRAGKFNPDTWHSAPISPLQKVFYRGQLLDKVSQDVATVAERTRALQPPIPEVLDVARIGKLMKGSDGPAAIGGLRGKVDEILSSVPPTPTGEATAVALRRASTMFERSDTPSAMARGHELANLLDESASAAGDEGTRVFVANAAKEIREQLGSDAFGEAGRQYRALSTPVQTLDNLTDVGKLRDALAGLQGHGVLPQALRQAQDQIAGAYDAAAKLAGVARPKNLAKELSIGEDIFHAAEEALTLDGKAMERVFEVSQHVGIHEAAAPHAKANEMTVADAVDGELDHVIPVLRDAATGGAPTRYRPGAAAAAAASLPLTVEEERGRYKERLDTLTRLQSGGEDMGALGEHPVIAADANDKMATLLRDMPKPPSTPLGPLGADSLSSDDLRLANAQWEATTEPLSVFRDLASGYIDPDKAAYAWKQYPGYQRACQAGIVDMLSNDLTQEERESIPENLLTQLDATFGFGGKLQETSDPFFAGRMSEIFVAEQEKRKPPPPGGMLKLPGAEPSFTERLANG